MYVFDMICSNKSGFASVDVVFKFQKGAYSLKYQKVAIF